MKNWKYINGAEVGNAFDFETQAVVDRKEAVKTAEEELRKAEAERNKHRGERYWEEAYITAKKDVERAKENLARAQKNKAGNSKVGNTKVKKTLFKSVATPTTWTPGINGRPITGAPEFKGTFAKDEAEKWTDKWIKDHGFEAENKAGNSDGVARMFEGLVKDEDKDEKHYEGAIDDLEKVGNISKDELLKTLEAEKKLLKVLEERGGEKGYGTIPVLYRDAKKQIQDIEKKLKNIENKVGNAKYTLREDVISHLDTDLYDICKKVPAGSPSVAYVSELQKKGWDMSTISKYNKEIGQIIDKYKVGNSKVGNYVTGKSKLKPGDKVSIYGSKGTVKDIIGENTDNIYGEPLIKVELESGKTVTMGEHYCIKIGNRSSWNSDRSIYAKWDEQKGRPSDEYARLTWLGQGKGGLVNIWKGQSMTSEKFGSYDRKELERWAEQRIGNTKVGNSSTDKLPSLVSEYNAEIQRLTRKAEQLRRMGQGKSAMEVEKKIEKLGKELAEVSNSKTGNAKYDIAFQGQIDGNSEQYYFVYDYQTDPGAHRPVKKFKTRDEAKAYAKKLNEKEKVGNVQFAGDYYDIVQENPEEFYIYLNGGARRYGPYRTKAAAEIELKKILDRRNRIGNSSSDEEYWKKQYIEAARKKGIPENKIQEFVKKIEKEGAKGVMSTIKNSASDDKFAYVMREFEEGKLKSSSGETVTDPAQAKAIAYSESKKAENGLKRARNAMNKKVVNHDFEEGDYVLYNGQKAVVRGFNGQEVIIEQNGRIISTHWSNLEEFY